ncbi:flagellar basal-body rod protein FlgF [Solirhodobacter olei]|uniref:flagellar basal-body rod protein FlgF n=1 Tax=Solirhodobacter olei TaxID=2493082 RepID=UPI000FDAA510|nr:flagellar basal-body rod protein FlgF [Solirhodobacter olei]
MDNSTFVALSLARTMEQSLDITANNIANANTAGFKAERADFQSLVSKSLGNNGTTDVNFVLNSGFHLDTSSGPLLKTGNPLDVAITGDGWFGYQTATGQTAYGRDGRLAVDANGMLVTTTGARILDASGSAIAIPPNAGRLDIASDGTITDARNQTLGQIGVFSVPDIATYQRIGDGMMQPPAGTGASTALATDAKVSQGFIEQSNVQPVLELTRMMQIQRAYERAMSLMTDQNTLSQQTLTQLGQTPA